MLHNDFWLHCKVPTSLMVAGLILKSFAKSIHLTKIIMPHYNRSEIIVHRLYDRIINFGHIVRRRQDL